MFNHLDELQDFHMLSHSGVRRGGAILSSGWTDEADAVAVRIADEEVASPCLLLEVLVERRAGRHVLSLGRFPVLGFDEGGDESIQVRSANSEDGLVQNFPQRGAVANRARRTRGWWTRTAPVGTERHTGCGRLLLFGRWRDSAASGAAALGRFASRLQLCLLIAGSARR